MNEDKEEGTVPFIDDLEIVGIIKDEVKEEEISVTDFIN